MRSSSRSVVSCVVAFVAVAGLGACAVSVPSTEAAEGTPPAVVAVEARTTVVEPSVVEPSTVAPSVLPEPVGTSEASVAPEPSAEPVPPEPSVVPVPASVPEPDPEPEPEAEPSAEPTPERAEDDGVLRSGESGDAVLAAQQRLSDLGYWLGTPDGSFGPLTAQAVMALQKAAGISRDGVLGPRTQQALAEGVRARARGSDGVEIDLDRQLLLVVRGGEVRYALNTSTGKDASWPTPRGEYQVQRAIDGMRNAPLGELWRPRYFNGGIAVHGSPSIPAYPASHGCARLTDAAIDMIWADDLMPIGSSVRVY